LGRLKVSILHLLRLAEVDRAVVYAVSGKIWLLVSAPITLYFISLYLTPEQQGFYYTFLSLAALQTFVELGFYIVITQFASHEWAHLGFDGEGFIKGKEEARSRLISLGHIICKWYSVASLIFIIGVASGGYFFLSTKDSADIFWEAPWFTYVILVGLQLWILPFLSLLEGCNQVANVYLFRLIQGFISVLVIWVVLVSGGGLWISMVSAGTGLLVNLIFFFLYYRNFFLAFLTTTPIHRIHWKTDIWPMQWRLAVSGITSFFMFSLFTPVMFHYHGSVVAGQMGMTWQLISVITSLSMAWVETKVPRFGMLIAKKEYEQLDKLFYKTAGVSLIVVTLLALGIWLAIYGLNYIQNPMAQRLLPPLPTGVFFLSAIIFHVPSCLAAYLRAHKREPFMGLSVATAVTASLTIWLFGSHFGPLGAAAAFLACVSFILVPFGIIIFIRCRKKWRLT